MRRRIPCVILAALSLSSHPTEAAVPGLCGPLRKFVESVKPDQLKTLKFHTSWGSDFKDSGGEPTIAAKRCVHNGYGPAKAVCAYFMGHGAAEFAGNNAKDALVCLSQKTHFADRLVLDGIEISLTYGTEQRGSLVDIKYLPDERHGGMVLSITVRGY